jgi:hypothetical protein
LNPFDGQQHIYPQGLDETVYLITGQGSLLPRRDDNGIADDDLVKIMRLGYFLSQGFSHQFPFSFTDIGQIIPNSFGYNRQAINNPNGPYLLREVYVGSIQTLERRMPNGGTRRD